MLSTEEGAALQISFHVRANSLPYARRLSRIIIVHVYELQLDELTETSSLVPTLREGGMGVAAGRFRLLFVLYCELQVLRFSWITRKIHRELLFRAYLYTPKLRKPTYRMIP